MHPPELPDQGMFNLRDQSFWQLVLLLLVLGLGAWMVSHMREMVSQGPDKEDRINNQEQMVRASGTPDSGLPRPRSKPFVAFDGSAETLPESSREAFREACAVLRRVVMAEPGAIPADCVRHPELTMKRIKSLPSGRWLIPVLPPVIGPQFGMTGDLLITTVHVSDGTERPVVLQKTAEGYKLDWEGFIGWCESDFATLRAHVGIKVHPRLMRVRCETTGDRPPFAGEKGLSLVMSHPAEKGGLSAFVPEAVLQQSAAAQELRSSTGGPFTLRIAADRETIRHGWVRVEEILCSGWTTDR